MNGEALLGPLPPNYDRVIQRSYSGVSYHAYYNHQAKQVHVENPRLGPLPENWRLKNHDQEHLWHWFVNDVTGEGHKNPGPDPRRTMQALRDRGVDLQDFELI
jgi:hypothetical protein